MTPNLLESMERYGAEQVMGIRDRESGTRAFLVLHDTSAGPAFGGIRRWRYSGESQALHDCLRLARTMTRKCALAGIAGGGGKVVLLDGDEVEFEAAYARIGRAVAELAGRFYTGPDVGTGERELAWVAESTSFVTRPGPEGPGELAEATAEGVFAGIGAALEHLDGAADWARRKIVIQGLGEVGFGLARRLLERGAEVLGSEIDSDRARRAVRELGLELVEPGGEYGVECDVFSPCALGGSIHDVTLQRLRTKIVAGAANNILAKPVHAARMHANDVLFVPDFVINSGALMRGAGFHLSGRREPLGEIGRKIAGVTRSILSEARSRDAAPLDVAVREAQRRIRERSSGTGEAVGSPLGDPVSIHRES